MGGGDYRTGELFSCVDLEARVRRDHPLRAIRTIVTRTLEASFPRRSAGEAAEGDAVAGAYSIRSERLLMERLEYDLLFRWFVGIGVDDAVWDHSVFSKNRDRLLEGEIAAKFLAAVPACCAEHQRPQLCDRRANDPARRHPERIRTKDVRSCGLQRLLNLDGRPIYTSNGGIPRSRLTIIHQRNCPLCRWNA